MGADDQWDEEALGRNEVLSQDDLSALRRNNPQALFRHLQQVSRAFLFGIEDHREEDEAWGGEVCLLINRNVVLHFVPGFNDAMTTPAELPQFCVMPDRERVDEARVTETQLDDGERVRGVVFTVDPYDYDALVGEAVRIAEEYPAWDLIPDTYYLDTELVRFVGRTVLEHPVVQAEHRYDFRLGMVGGEGPPAIDEEDLTAADMIGLPEGASPVPDVFAGDAVEDDEPDRPDDDDDDEPPLTGMRSHPVEWGGD